MSMSYTVIASAENGPTATVAPSVIDALLLARGLGTDDANITIATDTGWILTLDELEELAKS